MYPRSIYFDKLKTIFYKHKFKNLIDVKSYSLFRKLLMAFLVQLMFLPNALAQDIVVTGTVTDATSNEPLIGVSVVDQSKKSNGTATDFDGKFTIKVDAGSTLSFSYIGYSIKEEKVGGRTVINVKLSEDHQQLEEVVVIGYGTQKKADLTGAVAVVDMKEAKKMPSTNIYEMLQGQVTGVSVSTTSDPGSMSSVKIRGISSFSSV